MLVIDASVLFEILARSPSSERLQRRLAVDEEHIAPHVIDVEVFSVIRRKYLEGRLDRTVAAMAVEDLQSWPGERFDHRHLLPRAWELRHNVRGWDAFYVALAESFDATLVTADARLASADGPLCVIEVLLAEPA